MPDSILRSKELSPGAKLLYGRLCRFVGKNLYCWPSVAKLASLLGVSDRQIQNYFKELQGKHYLKKGTRFENGGQMTNRIELLWHPSFQNEQSLRRGAKSSSLPPVKDISPKESHSQESHSEVERDGVQLVSPKEGHKESQKISLDFGKWAVDVGLVSPADRGKRLTEERRERLRQARLRARNEHGKV